MADTKISALPASTTPLAGTEVLPIVQSGTTKQVSVANLTAGRALSATELTLSTGNLVIGTSGKGIDFSATPGTGTSELLSDYEEGTWTPTGNGITFASASGSYVRIGKLLTASFTIIFPTTVDVNNAQVIGFPFLSQINSTVALAGYSSDLTAQITSGASLAYFANATGTAFKTNANLSAQFIIGTVSYTV